MVRVEGLFGIPQFIRERRNAFADLLEPPPAGTPDSNLVGTGKLYTVAIYTCATCGQVELVDADKD